ncbi:unnamed protein product [Pseudo-nitzschia multistriata]|uniref:Uncharacterized protein n=1 Tax=Pseudo-nitzschia multistriata TaxID=183589 RepID=A0A448ZDH1_9STRA|nr:unnamed protein product [Pseudo-nitzschia multistriata]
MKKLRQPANPNRSRSAPSGATIPVCGWSRTVCVPGRAPQSVRWARVLRDARGVAPRDTDAKAANFRKDWFRKIRRVWCDAMQCNAK